MASRPGQTGPERPTGNGQLDDQVGSTADLIVTSPGPAEAHRLAAAERRNRRRARRRSKATAWAVRALSSPIATALTVMVAVAGLLLAFYVTLAQINLTNCLADYNEQAAAATAARADAAAQDRSFDDRSRVIDTDDRRLKSIDDEAINTALTAIGTSNQTDALRGLLRERRATAQQREANDKQRGMIDNDRAANNVLRLQHPLPPPPSQQCG